MQFLLSTLSSVGFPKVVRANEIVYIEQRTHNKCSQSIHGEHFRSMPLEKSNKPGKSPRIVCLDTKLQHCLDTGKNKVPVSNLHELS